MGHKISNAQAGQGAAFFGREPAWHRLGTVINDRDVYSEEALRLAHCDYEVKEAPIHAMTEGGIVQSTTHKMTYRDGVNDGDQPIQLGIVGSSFHVRQPRDTFAWVDRLVDADAVIETAGSLRNWRSIFVTCRMPDGVTLDPGGVEDRLEPYLFLRDAFDGQSSFTAGNTLVRIVCANTEAVALRTAKRTYRIQHRSGFDGHLATAREALGITFDYQQAVTPVFDAMARTPISDAQWGRIVEQLLVPDATAQPGQSGASAAAVRGVEQRREQLDAAYRDEFNAGITGTVWGAFNAYTSWLDHGRDTREADALETAVLEDTYASDKARMFRELRKMFPAVDRTAEVLAETVHA